MNKPLLEDHCLISDTKTCIAIEEMGCPSEEVSALRLPFSVSLRGSMPIAAQISDFMLDLFLLVSLFLEDGFAIVMLVCERFSFKHAFISEMVRVHALCTKHL